MLDLKGLVCPIPLHKQVKMVPLTEIISVTLENDLYIPGSSQLEVVVKLTGDSNYIIRRSECFTQTLCVSCHRSCVT